MTRTHLPSRGDLYGLPYPGGVGFVPRPAAVAADGLLRLRKPTWRDPRRFVTATGARRRGESDALHVLLIHLELREREYERSGVEALAGRISEVAAGFDADILHSAATQWLEWRSTLQCGEFVRQATVRNGNERLYVTLTPFTADLQPWADALEEYDERAHRLVELQASERARAERLRQDVQALRDLAERRGLEPPEHHASVASGIVSLSPELVDVIISTGGDR